MEKDNAYIETILRSFDMRIDEKLNRKLIYKFVDLFIF